MKRRELIRRALWVVAGFIGGALLAVLVMASLRVRLESPPTTLMLLDREGRFLGEVNGGADDERLGFWPIDRLPSRVMTATLAVEDRRFFDHPGVDPVAIARAMKQNLANAERLSGASTIAMQVARMQDPGPRTYLRKAVEAVTAVMLVAKYSRRDVLRQYLRLAPYGNNIHGIGYAARRYFDRPVRDLSWAQVAFLCALPQSPGRMNPYNFAGKERAAVRARRIVGMLRERGLIDDLDEEIALSELEELQIPARPTRPPQTLHTVLRLQSELGAERSRLEDQPRVETTLDLDLQRRVQESVSRAIERWRDDGAGNAAVVVVDRTSWEVRAAVGSTDWFDGRQSGSIDFSRTPRHPGSTLKPFLYAAAYDREIITPATVVEDLRRGPDGVGNADGEFLGPMLPRYALANSRNVPAVRLVQQMGLDETFGLLHDLGLHDESLPADHYGLGLALGGMPVSLVNLVQAYTTVAGDGRLQKLRWYQRQPAGPEQRVFSEASARRVTLHLSDPMARLPSFPRMGHTEYPFAVAVKTGTSADFRDAWTVGYSQRYLVGVWIGHPDWTPMKRISGYRAAARLLREVMMPLHADLADGLGEVSFAAPAGHERIAVCALSGHRATEACPQHVDDWFSAVDEPSGDCAVHVKLATDVRTGKLAMATTPARFVRSRVFVDLPPRWATWAQREKLSRVPSGGHSDGALRVEIIAPAHGSQILEDPESPDGTLGLEGSIEPPVEQAVWWVVGAPYATVVFPFSVRWPIRGGEHTFELRVTFVPGRRWPGVRVVVK